MPANTFASRSKRAPVPAMADDHALVNRHFAAYTCHMAAIHWAFEDLGDNQATANAKLTAVSKGICPGCNGNGFGHSPLLSTWYENWFCGGATPITSRAALHGSVSVGDVLVVRNNNVVTHSMVVVRKSLIGDSRVYIRGFNNFGTLGTGVGNQYDNADRNIDDAAFWWGFAGTAKLGTAAGTAGNLSVVSYFNFSARAQTVRNKCAPAGPGAWTYTQ